MPLGMPPPSYKKRPPPPLTKNQTPPPHEPGALAKPCSRPSPPPPPCRSAGGVPGNPLLPLPNWSKGRKTSLICTCDRLQGRCPFVASNLHHDLEVGERSTTSTTRIVLVKLSVFEGESFSNRYKLSPRCDLCSCNRRKNFCFLCNEPISGIRASSIRRCFVRLEHIEMWALIL